MLGLVGLTLLVMGFNIFWASSITRAPPGLRDYAPPGLYS